MAMDKKRHRPIDEVVANDDRDGTGGNRRERSIPE
jgi:hypothetical protein